MQQLKTTNIFKHLGVTLAPDGNPHYQFQVILQSTKTGSIIIIYTPFTYNQAFLYLINKHIRSRPQFDPQQFLASHSNTSLNIVQSA